MLKQASVITENEEYDEFECNLLGLFNLQMWRCLFTLVIVLQQFSMADMG